MSASDTRTGRSPRTSVWLEERPAPRRRGSREKGEDQPEGLDRGKIIGTAVRLLDADGLARFSMRRLATELGVTAMSVYWYVDSKDDLLELAMDAVEGELDLPDGEGRDGARWQDQLRALAYEYRRLFHRHPWVAGMMGSYLNVGPEAMAFSDASRLIVERSGLPPQRLTGALSAVFQFVYGFATIEASWNSRCSAAGLSPDEYFSTVHTKVRARPEYEESLRIMEQRGGGTVEEMRERDFTVALDCLVAGIEALRA